MASILFLIETIERNQFRYNYLENKKLFLDFCLHFRNLAEILNIFKYKDNCHSWAISEIRDSQKDDYINVEKVPFQGILRKATW